MASFPSYSLAKRHADDLVKGLAKGSQVTALHPSQARDAMAAYEQLSDLSRTTGQPRVSLLVSTSEYTAAIKKLNGHTLVEAIDGFLSGVASVKRVDLKQAIEELITSRQLKTVSRDGKRPHLSPEWHYILTKWWREFANTFPNDKVCDLTKEKIALYINAHTDVSTRTRNGRRDAVKMLLKWCTSRDYLSRNHRLFEEDSMKKENQDVEVIEFYTPKELRMMLDCASQRTQYKPLFAVIALGGLAGIRLQEIARLNWEDVFRVPKHVEITATKSKTRSRRLVEVVPSLAKWLKDFIGETGLIWNDTLDAFHTLFGQMLDELGIPRRRNGLRHAFGSFHYALHGDENYTAQQMGNSPSMVHGHYKGLATRAEAKKWFAVCPPKTTTTSDIKSANCS
jgi:integrase